MTVTVLWRWVGSYGPWLAMLCGLGVVGCKRSTEQAAAEERPDYFYVPGGASGLQWAPARESSRRPGVSYVGYEVPPSVPIDKYCEDLRRHLKEHGWHRLAFLLPLFGHAPHEKPEWRDVLMDGQEARMLDEFWLDESGAAIYVEIVCPDGAEPVCENRVWVNLLHADVAAAREARRRYFEQHPEEEASDG